MGALCYGVVGFDAYKVSCIIGVLPHERLEEQNLFIDLRVETEIGKAAGGDDLNFTIDYSELAALSQRIIQQGCYQLIETCVVEILDAILSQYAVRWAWVRITKSQAIPGAGGAVVELNVGKSNSDEMDVGDWCSSWVWC